MGKDQFQLRLLPTTFKKIGLGVLALSVLLFLFRLLNVLPIEKSLLLTVSQIGILISLLILALTKNKVEDELTLKIRVRAFANSFIFAVMYVIFDLFLELQFHKSPLISDGPIDVLLLMFIFYFLSFHQMLYNR